MDDNADSSEGDEDAPAGPSDHAMDEDSIQEFEGHQGEHQLSYCHRYTGSSGGNISCRRNETPGRQHLPACPAMHSCMATSQTGKRYCWIVSSTYMQAAVRSSRCISAAVST
jgi:hypothetical protein